MQTCEARWLTCAVIGRRHTGSEVTMYCLRMCYVEAYIKLFVLVLNIGHGWDYKLHCGSIQTATCRNRGKRPCSAVMALRPQIRASFGTSHHFLTMGDGFRLLPFEIIEKILALLRPKDVVKCKQVRSLRVTIVRLRYFKTNFTIGLASV